MLFEMSLIVTSLLLGSTLGRILAKVVVFDKGFSLFNAAAFTSPQIAQSKSYDLIEFASTIVLSTILFFVLLLLHRNKQKTSKNRSIVGIMNAIFAVIVNTATLFASYSGSQTVILIVFWLFVNFVITKKHRLFVLDRDYDRYAIWNGVFAGFYLSIVLHKITASIAIPLIGFALMPFFFHLLHQKYQFLKSPAFLLLTLAFAFPYNSLLLCIIGLLTCGICLVTKDGKFSLKNGLVYKTYPFFLLFIFLYNPTFYLGSFDTVEEGFWAGWMQRMLSGQQIYRDYAAYHPPLLVTGLFGVIKTFGPSLYNMRLFFHLLQIFGLMGIYGVLSKLTKIVWIRVSIFALIVAFSSSLVRNNMGIRLASGIAPLFLLYLFHSSLNKKYIVFAGVLTGVALLVSIETGMASLLSAGIVLGMVSRRKSIIRNSISFICGFVALILPVLFILAAKGSLSSFVEYLAFYAQSFSSGHQNIPFQRPEPSTLIQWFQVNSYLGTTAFLWDLIKYIMVGSLLFVLSLRLRRPFESVEVLCSGLVVFGLVLSRSALGRSDYYHVVFVLIIALLLLGYVLNLIAAKTKGVSVVLLCLFLFIVGRDVLNTNLLQEQLIKFQSYGNVSGTYPGYNNPRSGILAGIEIDTKTTDKLITFIQSNTSREEYIYAFPNGPEIYFLANRNNATIFDTPTVFYTPLYQTQTIEQLKRNKPKLIIYNSRLSVGGITTKSLPEIDTFITENYVPRETFGDNVVMAAKQ